MWDSRLQYNKLLKILVRQSLPQLQYYMPSSKISIFSVVKMNGLELQIIRRIWSAMVKASDGLTIISWCSVVESLVITLQIDSEIRHDLLYDSPLYSYADNPIVVIINILILNGMWSSTFTCKYLFPRNGHMREIADPDMIVLVKKRLLTWHRFFKAPAKRSNIDPTLCQQLFGSKLDFQCSII